MSPGITTAEDAVLSSSLHNISYCRVTGSVAYDHSNHLVEFELWLPSRDSYNGRFMVVGNGGFAGVIDTDQMASQLKQGFAVAGGDSGHRLLDNGVGGSGSYIPFLNNIEETKAWIHESIAIITEPTRKIATSFYNDPPSHSYYHGCSTGGAQGFALAQFHPHLFDGIYAGSPGNWYSHLMLSFLWNGQHAKGDAFIDQATLNATTEAILDACDELDGVKDRLIENPLRCNFDLDSLVCLTHTSSSKGYDTCLGPKQLEALKAIYAGPMDKRTNTTVYPGFSLGSERELLAQETLLYKAYAAPLLQNLIFHNLSYDIDTFSFERDVAQVDAIAGPLIDEIGVDLGAFQRRGGKMVVTQGWTDPLNAATWPIQHLEQLQKSSTKSTVASFFNLYMIPGGGHCGAASSYPYVPATYHVEDALVAWVENKIFPDSILSSTPPDGSSRTRKLCPWPKVAKIRNQAYPDVADSYDCVHD
ncbi:uncharacterized protein N7473_005624 [Penicillium subrubescens]|uniref:uncharacterized protein n=1 Tax=Penicillium subrubescens TaxID=1316194 RepID=UPI002544EBB6|nr:uncharacterized protein N7473_005624 [Penicillium subrubescens]KAJ5896225.1 hypothetical protein N7473_005624 [Penicillium subrubescens]